MKSTGINAAEEGQALCRVAMWFLAAMIATYTLVFGYLTWSQQANFGTFGYDMGIYDQGIWLLSRFKTPFLTVRGLNYFGHHVNLITLLFVPFYWLGAGPKFLYLAQTVVLGLGALPLWLLAKDRLGGPWVALVPAGAFLLYPSLEWINWWHFHPDALIITPLIFAWWLASRRSWKWFAVAVGGCLASKEDAALALLVMGGLIFAQGWWMRRQGPEPSGGSGVMTAGLLTMSVSVMWWLLCTKLIIPSANDGQGPFYGNLFPGFGSSVIEVVSGIIRNPVVLWEAGTRADCLIYYLKLFAPVAGLCLLSPVTLIGLPQLLVNVISAHGYTHDIKYHYSAIITAAVFLGTVEALSRLSKRKIWVIPGVVVLLCAAVWFNREWSPSPFGKSFRTGIWASPHDKHPAVRAALALVPSDARVTATYYIVPHLSQRQGIYEFPNPFITANWGIDGENPGNPEDINFLVLDTTLNGDKKDLYDQLIAPNGPFEIVFSLDGIVVAHRRSVF
ncbi:MAG: DUF2079 domain-containing protein [Proteobacteria bacterium]|nr:DUF2079 domain-containing protein [Desulfobulbaceae bacterium]MBU4154041.1 DUF2079 domain-containing protein [Pseudomonadota bacterium]